MSEVSFSRACRSAAAGVMVAVLSLSSVPAFALTTGEDGNPGTQPCMTAKQVKQHFSANATRLSIQALDQTMYLVDIVMYQRHFEIYFNACTRQNEKTTRL